METLSTMKKIIAVVYFIVFFLAGCTAELGGNGLPVEDTPVPTIAEEQATQAPVDVSDTDPTSEAIQEETPPIIPVSESAVCVSLADHPALAYIDYQTFPQAILDYLNAGASPEELAVTLIVQGLGPEEQPVWAEDLTGDGVREVVVTVYNETQPPQGALLIYDCVGGQYVLSYLDISEQQSHAPRLMHIQDINADGLREVVYSSTNCGAHTCFQDVQILHYENGVYLTKLEGSTLEFPYPELKLTDFDHDGMYSLEVVGTSIASVGAGPQRDSINIWDYDPASGTWKLGQQTQAASPFRVHLVHDANASMDRGEYLIASLLFQQVIEDEELLEWADEEVEYNNLAAYAYYKRIVAAVFMEDRGTAQALFSELEELYARSNQYAYVEMAEVFLADSETLGLEGGCTSARQYADANQFVVLTPLGSSVYGYANPDIEPADVCP
jgi:hypothetical protein